MDKIWLGGCRGLSSLGQSTTPEAFQIIEPTRLVPEQVDNDITSIDQHPVGLSTPLGNAPGHPVCFEALQQVFGHGLDMPAGRARGNDHGFGEAGFSGEIDSDGIDGLVIDQRALDELGDIGVRWDRDHIGAYDDVPSVDPLPIDVDPAPSSAGCPNRRRIMVLEIRCRRRRK